MEVHSNRNSDASASRHTITTPPRSFTWHSAHDLSTVQGTELNAYPTHVQQEIPVTTRQGRLAGVKEFWRKEVSLLVEPKAARDHLANERTFLAWLKTSVILSMMGVLTAQLFVLQPTHLPPTDLSFSVLGIPLASLCQTAALVNICIGAYRFWRHQSTLAIGQAYVGGPGLSICGGLIILVRTTYVDFTVNPINRPGRSSWCSLFSSSPTLGRRAWELELMAG